MMQSHFVIINKIEHPLSLQAKEMFRVSVTNEPKNTMKLT